MKKHIKFFIGIIFLICTALNLQAQVTISPTNLFVDSNNRFGTYMVINQSDQNQEISIDFLFEYSNTNEEGRRSIVPEDSAKKFYGEFSIHDHVRAFPQNFILPPGQRQVVRLRINPPANLTDGTYWARIRTTSSPESPAVELESEETISAQVGMNFEQITGLFYKKGNVTTGIKIEEINATVTDNGILEILTDFNRLGNSPFLGTISVRLLNDSEEVLADSFVSTTLYFNGTQKNQLDISSVPSGNYTLEISFETRRSDVSSQDLVQMEPVTATTTVTIP